MNSLFNLENPIFRFLGRLFDIIWLNQLFLICCLPIVTIGPALTALYYCMLKINREQDSSISSMFFYSFRSNLKQGLLVEAILIALSLFLFIDILACKTIGIALLQTIKICLYFFCVILVFIASYVFPLLAQFDNTVKNTLKNALLISINNVIPTIAIIILNSIPFVLLFVLPKLFFITLPIWLLLGLALIAYINTKILVKIFDKYILEYQNNNKLI